MANSRNPKLTKKTTTTKKTSKNGDKRQGPTEYNIISEGNGGWGNSTGGRIYHTQKKACTGKYDMCLRRVVYPLKNALTEGFLLSLAISGVLIIILTLLGY